MRAAVATRPHLPPRVVRRLAADPAPEVRRALARHATDPALLQRLAEQDAGIQRPLADNPSAPAPLLDRLRRAPGAKVRAAAEKALSSRAPKTA